MDQLCKLFVGGLNVQTSSEGLRAHFEQYGQLVQCVVVQNEQLQRSRCFGFVTFSRVEEADGAMAARPHTVDGKCVDLKRAVAREDAGKPEALAKVKKIFVGGLKEDITEHVLQEYFCDFGVIEKTEVIADKDTGKKRGFGFVHFEDQDAADKAVVLKFHTINGHKVEVKKALTKQEMQAGAAGGGGGGGARASRGWRGGGRGAYNGYDGGYCGAYDGHYGGGYEGAYTDQMYNGGGNYNDFGGGYSQQCSAYGPVKGGNAYRSLGPYPRAAAPGYGRGGFGGPC